MFRSLSILILLSSIPFAGQTQNRTYDGSQNNLNNPEWGAAHGHIHREMSNGYEDGISEPGMTDYTNPREISNYIFDQGTSIPNELNISDYAWSFGQFIDHDITLVDDMPDEFFNIAVPMGDPMFDPMNTGMMEIPMKRSKYDLNSGTNESNPRVQMNDITAWVDGSGVYGSDEVRANWLRTFEGGEMKVSSGNLLPFNTIDGEYGSEIDPNAPFMVIEGAPQERFFVAGDIRADEQPILTAYHTLFVREHNRLCTELQSSHPDWTDEQLYQRARKMVGALIQAITYNEWLPTLGVTIPDYEAYDEEIYPNIMNVFSAAAFRLGHTLLNGDLLRIDENGVTIPEGNMELQEAFFNPMVLVNEGGMDPLFRGMATQTQQRFDTKVVSDVRNFLFGPPGAGGLDLVAININRGRERGLPSYSTIREDLGLPALNGFADITSDAEKQFQLIMMYGSVDGIDPWVGMLAEDHAPGAAIGTTVQNIMSHQFERLRNGDRLFYLNDPDFSDEDIAEINSTKLSELIKRNTDIALIQEDVFHVVPFGDLVGLEENVSSTLSLSVYPNPSSGLSEFVVDAEGSLAVFTVDGRLIEERWIRPGKHLLDLNSGIHLVEFIDENGLRRSARLVTY